MKLSKGEVFTLNDVDICVEDLLGEGGQGEVYLVDKQGIKQALKLYKEEMGADFRYNLSNNVRKGSPSKDFLWPKEIIEFEDGMFGYLMDLRPPNYESFISFLTGKTSFKDQSTLLDWCIELCMAFKKLHEQGYSYQDLNDGSFFLDPKTGALLICDNDNVTANSKNLGILGKMRYMAPEIVRGDKDPKTGERQLPDIHSDRFSLAVILFLALCKGNPYEGECLKKYDIVDEDAEYEMFGSHPVFVYHKTDKSNRPIRGYHSSVLKRWAYLPIYVKEAFHRTFVDGLEDRENERTTDIEWISILSRYRDEIVTCTKCGYQYIYGLAEKSKTSKCANCNHKVDKMAVLALGRNRIVLEPNKKLYAHHLDKYSSEYNEIKGVVIRNKKNPALWGIRLFLDHAVEVKDDKGNVKEIAANGVIPIVQNLKIKFSDKAIGEIRL